LKLKARDEHSDELAVAPFKAGYEISSDVLARSEATGYIESAIGAVIPIATLNVIDADQRSPFAAPSGRPGEHVIPALRFPSALYMGRDLGSSRQARAEEVIA
jgi:hypothetical protein